MKISQLALPPNSLIRDSFDRIDYADAFSCEFRSQEPVRLEDVLISFFTAPPIWVDKLFQFRNRLVRLFGLKTPGSENREEALRKFRLEKGHTLGLFKVMEVGQDEVLLGEDDKHLNFRIGFLLKKGTAAESYLLVLSTTVQLNNCLGHLYFLPVKPFHKLVVPSMMKSMIQELQQKQNIAQLRPNNPKQQVSF